MASVGSSTGQIFNENKTFLQFLWSGQINPKIEAFAKKHFRRSLEPVDIVTITFPPSNFSLTAWEQLESNAKKPKYGAAIELEPNNYEVHERVSLEFPDLSTFKKVSRNYQRLCHVGSAVFGVFALSAPILRRSFPKASIVLAVGSVSLVIFMQIRRLVASQTLKKYSVISKDSIENFLEGVCDRRKVAYAKGRSPDYHSEHTDTGISFDNAEPYLQPFEKEVIKLANITVREPKIFPTLILRSIIQNPVTDEGKVIKEKLSEIFCNQWEENVVSELTQAIQTLHLANQGTLLRQLKINDRDLQTQINLLNGDLKDSLLREIREYLTKRMAGNKSATLAIDVNKYSAHVKDAICASLKKTLDDERVRLEDVPDDSPFWTASGKDKAFWTAKQK